MALGNRLIIGLGNPGEAYGGTRHNVGFAIVDHVAERSGATFRVDGRAASLVAACRLRGRSVVLAKPQGYVNRSGASVQHLVRRLGLETRDILVVTDDIHLSTGQLRLRERGGSAGHNGMQNIIDSLGTDAFPRLRMGIGSNFETGRQAEYVLSPFTEQEQPVISDAIARAREAVVAFVSDGIAPAMNRFNRTGTHAPLASATHAEQ